MPDLVPGTSIAAAPRLVQVASGGGRRESLEAKRDEGETGNARGII